MSRLGVLLQYLLPKRALSRLARALAASRIAWLKNAVIGGFLRFYPVNMDEAENPNPRDYASFGEFFTRALKPGARPLPANENQLCWPADGTLEQCGAIAAEQLVQAKGRSYALHELLQSHELAHSFADGWFATIYLAPHNYHRVHIPTAGQLLSTQHIPGSLFSVNRATARHLPRLFARNERTLCRFASPNARIGEFAVILVGAMLVSGIELTEREHYARGGEIGRFNYGSTVIVLFRQGAIEPLQLAASAEIRMGEAFAATGANGASAQPG